MRPLMSFRSVEAYRLTGITFRQLDYWARIGLVTPSLVEAKGSGSSRRYSYRDVLELKIIKTFLDGGHSLGFVKAVIKSLHEELNSIENVLQETYIVCSTQGVSLLSSSNLIDTLKQGRSVTFISISDIIQELDLAIEPLTPTVVASC